MIRATIWGIMDTKLLLTAIISFILGALLVAIAATTFENDKLQKDAYHSTGSSVAIVKYYEPPLK